MMCFTNAFRHTPLWESAMTLVRHSFAAAFGAVTSGAPESFLVAYEPSTPEGSAANGAVLACVGITPAARGPLFCEQYFDEPAEQVVGARLGRPAHRRDIMEVGPFAAQEPGAGAEILAVLPMFAWECGMRYGLVTVTRRMTLMLRRQRYTFEPLVDARPERLAPDQRERWGTYYDNDPQTGLIRLEHLAPVLAQSAGRYRSVDLSLRRVDDGIPGVDDGNLRVADRRESSLAVA
ncbi:thermostable hemolysin [Micromonospora sp. WMMD1120]|uniref:thermostable hemolysin n=1 Tax=Micromonospora sp. WMMD1120 TaxID=3016106 RepID=UPI002416E2FA|nr:thermostable hemolysin [Micromonospora sp. WMMD1120]MDG4809339.1 thermostable hemolysin [Micromonospora sp. WMMD1120]